MARSRELSQVNAPHDFRRDTLTITIGSETLLGMVGQGKLLRLVRLGFYVGLAGAAAIASACGSSTQTKANTPPSDGGDAADGGGGSAGVGGAGGSGGGFPSGGTSSGGTSSGGSGGASDAGSDAPTDTMWDVPYE